LYTAPKTQQPQPYKNQSVFKSLLNCASEMSLSRNATGGEFQRYGPATEKLLSPRRVRVLIVAYVKTSADRSDRRPMSVKSWQSSARYCAQEQLTQFDADGDELRRVQLSGYMEPRHAAESLTGTFIVGLYNQQLEQAQVAEINTGGEVLRFMSTITRCRSSYSRWLSR